MDRFTKIKNNKKRLESGMTMLELLIVISIVAVLLVLGLNSYISMRRIQQLEQTSRSLYDLVRNSQRDALLYNRTLGENWVWGTVLSLEDLNGGDSIVKTYKYCAPQIFTEFQAYPDTTIQLPTNAIAGGSKCNSINSSLVLLTETRLGDNVNYFTSKNKNLQEIRYVVFETISGKIHYYAADGSYVGGSSSLEFVLGNDAPSRSRISFAADKSKFYLEKVDADYQTQ